MKYVLVGLAFGLLWAAIQYSRGTVSNPVALIGPVLLFGLFGVLLWGVRTLLLRLRRNRR